MKITVITATYNSAQTLEQCMQSVLSQTYHPIEYLIIDGASTDGTLAVAQGFINTHQQTIKIISEPDQGIYDALNKGLSLATGDIIGFLHADDLFESPLVLEQIASVFKSHQACDAVYGNLQYVSKDNTNKLIRNWVSKSFSPELLHQGWMPPHPTLFLRQEVYEHYGQFDTSFSIAADYDFMLRIFSGGIASVYLNQYITKMRVGGKSNSLNNLMKKMKEDLKALRKNKVGGFYSLFLKNISKVPQFFK